jgi:hypothetical protein
MRNGSLVILVIVGLLMLPAGQATGGNAPQGAPSLWQDATLKLATPEDVIQVLAVDSAAGFLYVAVMARHEDFPALILKLRLSDLSRVAVLPLEAGETWLTSGALDITAG